jgi:high affinity Mn2+ porin
VKNVYVSIAFVLSVSTICGQTSDSLRQERFSIHAQATIINQQKPHFKAAYSGENSLVTKKEQKTSITSTLFLGARLWKGASLVLNPEIAGGSGLSEALGVADAPNGETFRVGDPTPQIYLARLFIRQLFPLGDKKIFVASDFNQTSGYEPEKYISLTVGKIGLADYFDDNVYSHDPRTQFMSWGLMSNGAYDYPANTRGYTPAIVAEYVGPTHELRYAFALVPETANGLKMNWHVGKAGSHSLEYAGKYMISGKSGVVRLLGFLNVANMGNYDESVLLKPQSPDILATRKTGRTKSGFGINAEQEIHEGFGCFIRASWNDGRNETWAFTEIDRSFSVGLSSTGKKWKRDGDAVGLAFVTSGLSKDHRNYLKAGGKGFMLGDGNLNYTHENLTELYYSAGLSKDHLFLSAAYQFLVNSGYNRDRKGPVNIFSLRLHMRV